LDFFKEYYLGIFKLFRDLPSSLALILPPVIVVFIRYVRVHFGIFPSGFELLERMTWELLFFFLVPLGLILGMKKRPQDFGLGLGSPRIWLKDVLLLWALTLPFLIWAAHIPSFQHYYPRFRPGRTDLDLLLLYEGLRLVYFIGWEFLFRGFMLFSLFPKLGFLAILVQAIPFTLAHLGKPVMEVYGSLPAGIFLGILAYRGRSVIGCGLLHFLVASSLDFLLFFGWSQPHL
jgi:hypothetical protein